MRIYQFVRGKGASAFLTLISIGLVVAALRAGSHYVTVCQKDFCRRIVVLLAFLLHKFSVFIEFLEKLGCGFCMNLGTGSGIYTETDSETVERVFDYCMILINDFLWRTSQILGFECNRNSVLIASANEQHVFSFKAEIADIDVCRNINAGKVTDVYAAVCIRKCGGDQMSLE